MSGKKRTPSQVGKGSKQKGSNFENEISKRIRKYFIPGVDKKTAYNLVHRTGMSGGRTERGDLIVQPPLLSYFPWFVEARNRQSWSWENIFKKGKDSVIFKWYLEDACDKCHPYAGDPRNERYPLLVFTKNQDMWYVMASEEDLLSATDCLPVDFRGYYRYIWDRETRGKHGVSGSAVILPFEDFIEAHDNLLEGVDFDSLEFK